MYSDVDSHSLVTFVCFCPGKLQKYINTKWEDIPEQDRFTLSKIEGQVGGGDSVAMATSGLTIVTQLIPYCFIPLIPLFILNIPLIPLFYSLLF